MYFFTNNWVGEMPTIMNLLGTPPFWFHFLEAFMKKEWASEDTQLCLPARVPHTKGDKDGLSCKIFLSDSRTSPTNTSFSYVTYLQDLVLCFWVLCGCYLSLYNYQVKKTKYCKKPQRQSTLTKKKKKRNSINFTAMGFSIIP